MKNILFLLLFLQVNLVFGQKSIKYDKPYVDLVAILYEENKSIIGKAKTVFYKMDFPQNSALVFFYLENGKLEFCQFQDENGDISSKYIPFYHQNGDLEKEEVIKIDEDTSNYTIVYKKYLNDKDTSETRAIFHYHDENEKVKEIAIEKFYHNRNFKEKINIKLNYEKTNMVFEDSIFVKKMSNIEFGRVNFEANDIDVYEYTSFQFDKKDRPIREVYLNLSRFIKKKDFHDETVRTDFQYETDTSGFYWKKLKKEQFELLRKDKTQVDTNRNNQNKEFRFDERGNWDVKRIGRFSLSKRKIEYYD